MRNHIGLGLLLATVMIGSGFWVHAQVQAPPNNPRVPPLIPPPGFEGPNSTVVSGSDVGFRIDAWDGDTPLGRWVIRSNGRWVEPRTAGGSVRRLTSR
jgi:hypothetical protein